MRFLVFRINLYDRLTDIFRRHTDKLVSKHCRQCALTRKQEQQIYLESSKEHWHPDDIPLPETITDPKWVEFWNYRTQDENGKWQDYETYYRDEWENIKQTEGEQQ